MGKLSIHLLFKFGRDKLFTVLRKANIRKNVSPLKLKKRANKLSSVPKNNSKNVRLSM